MHPFRTTYQHHDRHYHHHHHHHRISRLVLNGQQTAVVAVEQKISEQSCVSINIKQKWYQAFITAIEAFMPHLGCTFNDFKYECLVCAAVVLSQR